tara:strand:- start:508 stop:642 length:135 start_codon:yes stop_codon:yes gene_type:complete
MNGHGCPEGLEYRVLLESVESNGLAVEVEKNHPSGQPNGFPVRM